MLETSGPAQAICQPPEMLPGPETQWAPPICPLSQTETVPLSFCQRISSWELLSKSPMPTMCQALGTTPAPAIMWAVAIWPLSRMDTVCAALELPSSQTKTVPSSSRHNMSPLPLPSKSAAPAICELLGTAPEPDIEWAPLGWPLSHANTVPSLFRQRTSLRLSP